MRRYSLGDTNSEMRAMFDEQLKSFKKTLVDLYKLKTKTIASREALRFQYLTGMKNKLNSIFSEMYAKAFADGNEDGNELLRIILASMTRFIPMTTISGQNLQGWGQVVSIGGDLNLNLISPADHILSKPFFEPGNPDQRPSYKIYGSNFFTGSSFAPANFLRDYWITANSVLDYASEQRIDFEMPPSAQWVQTYLYTNFGGDKTVLLMKQYPYVVDLLTKTYISGNLPEALEQAKKMIIDLLDSTREMVRIQDEIDDTQNSLSSFIEEYTTYFGSSITLAQMLTDIELEAQKADMIPAVSEPDPVTELVPETVSVLPTGKENSKLPLYAALAAGIFFLTKGK